MEEEKDVLVEDTTTDSSPEGTEAAAEDTDVKEEDSAVDDKGVPVKNRLAEANRKLRKFRELQESAKGETPATDEEALTIVRQIAREENQKALEPLMAEQFLMKNPDAVDMIEDINRVRQENPELAGIDKLHLAYKIAKAERQDEIIAKKVEAERAKVLETKEISKKSTSDGVGRSTPATVSIADKVNSATTLEELRALESEIR